MRLTLILAAFITLLLAACAQRTYVVYPPQAAAGRNSCEIDFTRLVLGETTVRDLQEWAAAAALKPRCEGLELRFHRRGEALKGPGTSPAPDGLERVHQLVLDSAPERPALKYPPIIRAVVGEETTSVEPGPTGTGVKDCPVQCPTGGGPGTGSPPAGRSVGQPNGLPPAAPVPDPGETDEDEPGDPKPPIAADPPQADSGEDEDEGDPGRRRPPRSSGGGPSSDLAEALPPALLGGGIVYALALMKLLPFAGAPAAALPRRPARPSWSADWPEDGAAVATPAQTASSEGGDPRVRLRSKGFET